MLGIKRFSRSFCIDDFRWHSFEGKLILKCVGWYYKYGISYRDLEEMMEERGLSVDPTTIYRWVQLGLVYNARKVLPVYFDGNHTLWRGATIYS